MWATWNGQHIISVSKSSVVAEMREEYISPSNMVEQRFLMIPCERISVNHFKNRLTEIEQKPLTVSYTNYQRTTLIKD